MSDDLVERVAKAMCGCEGICFTSCGTEPCQMAEENYAKAARAAIAVALEDAAKVCDEAEKRERQAAKEPCDMEELAAFQRGAFMSRINAAAIRSLIGKQGSGE